MRIIFAGSEKQQMPSIVFALHRMGHEVAIYPRPMESVNRNETEEKNFKKFLREKHIDFVISNIFTPAVAEITHSLNMKYAVYGMDSPMYATYHPIVPRYDNCYLFYFDYKEYQMLKNRGYKNVYYLPLAADTVSSGELVITDEEIRKYNCDISFVGSLYTKNVYDQYIERFSYRTQNAFSAIIENSAFLWDGKDRMMLSPELVQTVRHVCPELFDEPYEIDDEYLLRTFFLARKLTNVERTLLMELLAERYDINLYTWAAEKVPEGIKRFPEVDAGGEALKVFYASKINLNITLRSIETGIPARVFDVMSVGGFVLSNWQEEIPELFEEDKEIVTFKTPEELMEKADYYLKHDRQRTEIGIKGYQRVKADYTYEHQIGKIISILFPNSK